MRQPLALPPYHRTVAQRTSAAGSLYRRFPTLARTVVEKSRPSQGGTQHQGRGRFISRNVLLAGRTEDLSLQASLPQHVCLPWNSGVKSDLRRNATGLVAGMGPEPVVETETAERPGRGVEAARCCAQVAQRWS
jgi:hypothetical protein